jgi:hypothetical protein
MDKISFTFASGVFVTFLIALSSLGMPFVSSPASPDDVSTDTNVCDNIGGFDAVGDVLECVSSQLSILDYLNVNSENRFITLALIPMGLTTGIMIILIVRGN